MAVLIELDMAWSNLPTIIDGNEVAKEEDTKPMIIMARDDTYSLLILNLVIRKAERGMIFPMTRE